MLGVSCIQTSWSRAGLALFSTRCTCSACCLPNIRELFPPRGVRNTMLVEAWLRETAKSLTSKATYLPGLFFCWTWREQQHPPPTRVQFTCSVLSMSFTVTQTTPSAFPVTCATCALGLRLWGAPRCSSFAFLAAQHLYLPALPVFLWARRTELLTALGLRSWILATTEDLKVKQFPHAFSRFFWRSLSLSLSAVHVLFRKV